MGKRNITASGTGCYFANNLFLTNLRMQVCKSPASVFYYIFEIKNKTPEKNQGLLSPKIIPIILGSQKTKITSLNHIHI